MQTVWHGILSARILAHPRIVCDTESCLFAMFRGLGRLGGKGLPRSFTTGPTTSQGEGRTLQRLSDYNMPYPKNARPAYLFDLFNKVDLEPKGALLVSAVDPIVLTIRHLGWSGREEFCTTLTVSPFESAVVFWCRIDFALSQYNGHVSGESWYMPDTQWEQNETDWDYIPIHSIGIFAGYVMKTVQKRPVKSLSADSGWEMALSSAADRPKRFYSRLLDLGSGSICECSNPQHRGIRITHWRAWPHRRPQFHSTNM